jgi:hypothetical protein
MLNEKRSGTANMLACPFTSILGVSPLKAITLTLAVKLLIAKVPINKDIKSLVIENP